MAADACAVVGCDMIAHASHYHPGASGAAAEIIELNARLRLACAALGVDPDDVRVDDLADAEQMRLRDEARADFWAWVSGGKP